MRRINLVLRSLASCKWIPVLTFLSFWRWSSSDCVIGLPHLFLLHNNSQRQSMLHSLLLSTSIILSDGVGASRVCEDRGGMI